MKLDLTPAQASLVRNLLQSDRSVLEAVASTYDLGWARVRLALGGRVLAKLTVGERVRKPRRRTPQQRRAAVAALKTSSAMQPSR